MLLYKSPVGAVLHWTSRCCVGLSLIALFGLAYLGLFADPRLSSRRTHSIGDDGLGPRAVDRHVPGSQHDHGAGSTTLTYSRCLFVAYSLLVHITAAAFPIRAAIAIFFMTKRIAKQAMERVHGIQGTSLSAASARSREGVHLSTLATPHNDGEVSDSGYDGDSEGAEEGVIHAIVIPNFRENPETLRETLGVLASHSKARSSYDVYLAMEDAEEESPTKAARLCSQFQDAFRSISYTVHPSGISGESAGKSSNLAWAANQLFKAYSSARISLSQDVIVTVMDSDSLLMSDYFEFITNSHLEHAATADTTLYTPPIIFDRNSNSVPACVRVADLLWAAAGLSGLYPYAAICPPTSVYSIPLTLVRRVGGWDTGPDAIGEDLHMYLKCFFTLKGNLVSRSVPSPASQCNLHSDVKGVRGWFDAHIGRYNQALRHMWGSLDSGFALRRLMELCRGSDCDEIESSSMPSLSSALSTARTTLPVYHWANIAVLFQRLFEAHFLPLHLLICTLSGELFAALTPSYLVDPELVLLFRCTALLRLLGFLGLVHFTLHYELYHSVCVKRREEEMKRAGLYDQMQGSFVHRKMPWVVFDYVLLPVAGILYGSIPALHAQISHFWTPNLTYVVSSKPSVRPAVTSDKLV